MRDELTNHQADKIRNHCNQERMTTHQADLIINAITAHRLGVQQAETRMIGAFMLWSESEMERARAIFYRFINDDRL